MPANPAALAMAKLNHGCQPARIDQGTHLHAGRDDQLQVLDRVAERGPVGSGNEVELHRRLRAALRNADVGRVLDKLRELPLDRPLVRRHDSQLFSCRLLFHRQLAAIAIEELKLSRLVI